MCNFTHNLQQQRSLRWVRPSNGVCKCDFFKFNSKENKSALVTFIKLKYFHSYVVEIVANHSRIKTESTCYEELINTREMSLSDSSEKYSKIRC